MFLDFLEAFGTFCGGLGALIAATTQLLTFLKKKDGEQEPGRAGDEPASWMIPLGPVPHLVPAF